MEEPNTAKDGGAVYPCRYLDKDLFEHLRSEVGVIPAREIAMVSTMGMSLRDWFAGQAIGGLITAVSFGKHHPNNGHGPNTAFNIAIDAYNMADAMLAARGQS